MDPDNGQINCDCKMATNNQRDFSMELTSEICILVLWYQNDVIQCKCEEGLQFEQYFFLNNLFSTQSKEKVICITI